MAEFFTPAEVLGCLKEAVRDYASASAAARDIGISRQSLNGVLRGRRKPYGKILKWLGFQRVIAYRDKSAP